MLGLGGPASFAQTNSPPQLYAPRQLAACGPAETCQTCGGPPPETTPTPPPIWARSMKAIFHCGKERQSEKGNSLNLC